MSYVNSVNQTGRGAEQSTPSRTLVIGLGNPILGDDGVGWRVAEALKESQPAVEIDCLALGGLSLMERLVGYNRVIIIDSIQTHGGVTGQVYTFPLDDLPDLSAGHTTAVHDTSLPTALKLGRAMGAILPEDVMIVAIEADRVFDFTEQLTPDVEAAIPVATKAVMKLLNGKVID